MTQHQPYDHALKSLLGDHAAEIIPQLIPDTEVVREQNVELKRELLRADLVYLVRHKGKPRTLNLELQTNADVDMEVRLLLYHAELYDAYRLPVLSVVLYLFEANIPTPPFREPKDEEEDALLLFQYRVLRLWTLDAREYLEKHLIFMYTFLPAMKQANASLLIQALEEMKQFYSHTQFVRHASRFRTILKRSTMISVQDKHTVEEYMDYHYDSLLDEDPEIKEKIAQSKLQGELQGKVEALQEMAMVAVKDQYPTLAELAQERVLLVRQPEMLRQLVKQIYKAPDETTARWVLNTFAA